MRNRPAFDLKWFMVIYNLGLVALSLYMFLEVLLSVWDAEYDLLCSVYNKNSWTNPKELRVANVLWWYFFSKAIEFMDTVLMVLRKKNEQITFLHVFHHASMLNIWWWTLMFIPGGMSWFGSCMNCLVHVVMYSYYGLSALPSLKGKLWWKRYITRFQLLQFCVTFTHTVNSIRIGCEFPRWGQNLLSSYMVFMLFLFGNFYINAYIKRRSHRLKNGGAKAKDICSSSSVANGNAKTSQASNLHRTKVE
ncbi:elongation of very long chain fatty acids protein 2-like [Pomacea canaliculata]|uniref:elongation of very long chain fatty acids protein 2-like n=1 Tax=Pomacea canaliculata TaxID=400727 RepID=UPI000D731E11|nr:elongation of very long chain fatty acids protein 2-like [Pomacea canaliculata]XP_025110341.1 elongation of very long chain fatty acids protein 2-like [Pomacea canaliculata]